MAAVIKVEDVSKLYRLGKIGSGTVGADLQRWWTTKVLGNEDPFLKLGETNDRTSKGKTDIVYSLKNINFDIEQGDAVGIIGRNGAGKSTLLKILSRVTSPTSGSIKIKGRVASLLEVGTGFHPELSGRENIFLNGAILGMRKKEISRKLDEIIDFSGVERYIDTPVKRYSSGMYVRLAFSVAAHLESEILIVDEVLAVGDADFQKKCLGKMGQVSKGEGRTILFVSHNMPSIKALCKSGIYLNQGEVFFQGSMDQTIAKYFESKVAVEEKGIIPDLYERLNTGQAKIRTVHLLDENNEAISSLFFNQKIRIKLCIEVFEKIPDAIIDIKVMSKDGVVISYSLNAYNPNMSYDLSSGEHNYLVEIENILTPDFYNLTVGIHYSKGNTIDYLESIYDFEVLNVGNNGDYGLIWKHGFINLQSTWQKI